MQKADYLLRLMKQRTDALVASDEKLQQFLMWVNEKSLSVEVPYKPAAVRAFYFALDPARQPVRQSPFCRKIERAFERILDPAFEPPIVRPLIRALIHTLDPALRRVLEADREQAFEPPLVRILDPAFNGVLVPPALDIEVRQALQELKEQLPDRDSNKEIYKQWWKANGQVWTRQLREITISHRNNSHKWQFSEQQRKELQQYYDANQLLVDCLHRSCNVTPEVRNEIEETLFLPIAEIDKPR
jgi:predicted NACHT family NTPase